jgi:hypothetical protein
MEIKEHNKKTGRWGSALFAGLTLVLSVQRAVAQNGTVNFTAEVDSHEVSLQDSVVLTLSVKSEGSTALGEPSFDADDFDIDNRSSAVSIGSQYDSTTGQMATLTEKTVQVLLRPKKKGLLKISHIQLTLGGGPILKAPDLQVTVTHTGKPTARVQMGSSRSARGRAADTRGVKIAVKAEVDHPVAYKGQKVVASFYIDHQPKVFNVQVDQFPSLTGFLREDLDNIAMGQNLGSEAIKINGEPYERSLLARYAAYPLEAGQLMIDSMSVKFNFLQGRSRMNLGMGEDEDPFFGFFNQMAPRAGSGRTEPVKITVLPLPESGRPSDFSGGVGDFNLVSVVDKYEVHANEAVTVTLKIEGDGNMTALEEPRAKWPTQVELYETKGRALPSRGGLGAKVFEFLLIARSPGKLVLPSVQMAFFDPVKKAYYTRSTEPIEINVTDPLPGSALPPSRGAERASPLVAASPVMASPFAPSSAAPLQSQIRGLMPPEDLSAGSEAFAWGRALGWASAFAGMGLLGLVLVDEFRKRGLRGGMSSEWKSLQGLTPAQLRDLPPQGVVHAYELLTNALLGTIDQMFGTSARSTGRAELRQKLLESPQGLGAKISEDLWQRVTRLLDFADQVRFAGSSGGEADVRAREQLPESLTHAQELMRQLANLEKKP